MHLLQLPMCLLRHSDGIFQYLSFFCLNSLLHYINVSQMKNFLVCLFGFFCLAFGGLFGFSPSAATLTL